LIISKGFIHPPSSQKAKEMGCTCKLLPSDGKPGSQERYMIDQNCPIHWSLDIVQMQTQLDYAMFFIQKAERVNSVLMFALITLFVFVSICFFSTT
jgi:hypothetical protein